MHYTKSRQRRAPTALFFGHGDLRLVILDILTFGTASHGYGVDQRIEI